MSIKKRKTERSLQQAYIEALSHDGRGIARLDGKVTFIEGALKDEEVSFYRTRQKKDFDEGQVVEILKPSEFRVSAKCPHYELCGGCSAQHIEENAQIALKEAQLLALFQRIAKTQPQTVLKPLRANAWHYRNKARLSVRYVEKKGVTLVGFRERHNPRYITQISQCPILHAQVDRDLPALSALLDSLSDRKSIAQIELAASDSEVALIFRHLSALSATDLEQLRDFGTKHQYLIFLQPSGPQSVTCLYPEDFSGYLSYTLPEYGLRYSFYPTDFTQVNALLNQKMVALALDLMSVNADDVILDLFCGLGNFSLPLAQKARQVIGYEGSACMTQRAALNAAQNHLSHALFYEANLDDPMQIPGLASHRANKLLLDPPRQGALALVEQMELLKPERIVYVSCNPATLARDTDILVNKKGYTLSKAGVMDMFPHTAHVESIALFTYGSVP